MASDNLVPACGGTEQPFTVNGRKWLYCYHPASGKHCYLDMGNDIAVWHRSFHPVHAPEFEFVSEEQSSTKSGSEETAIAESTEQTSPNLYF